MAKKKTNSIEELKQIYQTFIENDQLWWSYSWKLQFKLISNSWSVVQNINNWWFWIRKKLDLRNHQPDINIIYLYTEDPHEAKYQLLIQRSESKRSKHYMILKPLLNTQMIWNGWNKNTDEDNQ